MKTALTDFKEDYQALSEIKEGRIVTIRSIDSGLGAKGRLFELGIYPGEPIKVVRNRRYGPVLVLVKESTFMLGRGMTKKIFVK